MHVLLVNTTPIPVYAYGGTERVIWDLGKSLVKLGHKVSYLVPQGSHCEKAIASHPELASVFLTPTQHPPSQPRQHQHGHAQHGCASKECAIAIAVYHRAAKATQVFGQQQHDGAKQRVLCG